MAAAFLLLLLTAPQQSAGPFKMWYRLPDGKGYGYALSKDGIRFRKATKISGNNFGGDDTLSVTTCPRTTTPSVVVATPPTVMTAYSVAGQVVRIGRTAAGTSSTSRAVARLPQTHFESLARPEEPDQSHLSIVPLYPPDRPRMRARGLATDPDDPRPCLSF